MELVMLPHVAKQARATSRTVQGRQAAIRDREKEKEGARTDQFILVSCLPENMRRLVSLHRDEPFLGLTAIILTIVYLSGGEVGQSDLMDHLKALEIDRDGDETFGRLEDQLDLMRRDKYLYTYKAADEDGTPMWGADARGRQEFPPEALQAFALELVRGTDKDTADLTERIGKSFAPEPETVAMEED